VAEGVGDHGCEYMTSGLVVILGSTGRNFGAGMSGGIAYVYDPYGKLKDNCNTGLVSLAALNDEDAQTLHDTIERHFKYTGSDIAEAILGNFKKNLKSFIKVIPDAYQKVLDSIRLARISGVPEEDIPLYVFNEARSGKPEEKKD
jgi:glutamate synthase (NADPH/NADH) large chain